MKRIQSIDIVRGLVMIIMALDHTRDMLHLTSISDSPTNLATTTPALFFTRWITHFCAPVFVFLAGTSAFLTGRKLDNPSETRRYLFSRGLILVILEFTLVNFALWFDPLFRTFIFQVIAAIGFGFIVLGLMLRLSRMTIGIVGLIIIFGHNLLPLIQFRSNSLARAILAPLFAPGAFQLGSHVTFVMGYPLIPWLGIMLAGYAAGSVFEQPEAARDRILLRIGGAALALFLVLRFINVYGDPLKWSSEKTPGFTVLSFFNVSKYPPSLLFTLMTLGGMFIALSIAGKFSNWITSILVVYGRVPLFYFLIHLYIIHILMFAMVFMQGFHWSDLVFGFNLGRPKEGSGVGLGVTFLIWVLVVIGMYGLCKWYGAFKDSHRSNLWLRYL